MTLFLLTKRLLLGLAAALLWPQQRQRLAWLLACSTPVFLGAFLVMDITRSLSYSLSFFAA